MKKYLISMLLITSCFIYADSFQSKLKEFDQLVKKSSGNINNLPKIISFLNQIDIITYSKILITQNSLDGAFSECIRGDFALRLSKEFSKINLVEKEFLKKNIDIFSELQISPLDEKKLIEFGIQAKNKNNFKDLYNVKRYIVFNLIAYPHIDQNSSFILNTVGENIKCDIEKENCWRYGYWALFDNDEKTTAVINQNDFLIDMRPNQTIKIFNGNGKSEDLYYKNSRIKKLSGKSQSGKQIEINFQDTLGWKEIKLPSEIQENIQLKIAEIYNGTKYKDLCVSELRPVEWEIKEINRKNKIYQIILNKLNVFLLHLTKEFV